MHEAELHRVGKSLSSSSRIKGWRGPLNIFTLLCVRDEIKSAAVTDPYRAHGDSISSRFHHGYDLPASLPERKEAHSTDSSVGDIFLLAQVFQQEQLHHHQPTSVPDLALGGSLSCLSLAASYRRSARPQFQSSSPWAERVVSLGPLPI